ALARATELTASALAAAVRRLDRTLQGPVHHHLGGGGKRLRAALVLVSAAAAGAPEAAGVPGAVAVELVHNYSLLHDDIIDGDQERRHRPAVWVEYGVGPAIVAGDALAGLATQVLLEDPTPERVRAAARLAEANQAMIAGQAADMAFERRPTVSVVECLAMEEGKTGALLACASAVGALLAGAPASTVGALDAFGCHLGIAFQAVDDLLGIWGQSSVTGKPVGSDLLGGKKTLPVAVAMARGGSAADELTELLSGEMGEADVIRATALVERCGGRAEVVELADRHLHRALDALGSADLAAAPRDELLAIARYVTARDR
ncbi:MAG: polyprenyl synthetase family protein, partial [Acidimicrobiales bacterium]